MKKDIVTHCKKVIFGLFILTSSSLSAATVTWTGNSGDGLWSSAGNWDTNSTPGTVDNVVIPATFTANIAADAGKINKLTVSGKLIITASGALNIEQTTVSTAIVELVGGEIENAGTFSIKQMLGNNTTVALRFSDNVDRDDKFSTTGALTIENTASTNTSTSGRCISFSQTTAGRTARLVLGGTLTFNVKTSTRFIELQGGQAEIGGTATIGSTEDYKNWRFMHLAPVTGVMTIAEGANITMYTAFDSTNGCININAGTAGNVVFNNNGNLTLNGGGTFASNTPYGIFLNPQATASTTSYSTFNNAGTLTINGNFPGGGIYLSGSQFVGAFPTFNNLSGATLNVVNTSTGMNATPLRATIVTITNIAFNNSGTASFTAANPYSLMFGSNNSTFTNTGSVTVNKAITGYSANTTACTINNNTGGTFNFNVADNEASAISTTNKIIFNNNGGTVTGRGVIGAGTFTPLTGTLSPGGAGIGTFSFADAALALTGKFQMDIQGKTTAGTDFDQIVSTGTLDLSGAELNVAIGGSYTPVSQDIVPLLVAASRTGNFSSVTAPTSWIMNYNDTNANILYDNSTNLKTVADNVKLRQSNGNIEIQLLTNSNATLNIFDISGKSVYNATLISTNNTIDTRGLMGIYLIRIVSENTDYIQKIVL